MGKLKELEGFAVWVALPRLSVCLVVVFLFLEISCVIDSVIDIVVLFDIILSSFIILSRGNDTFFVDIYFFMLNY